MKSSPRDDGFFVDVRLGDVLDDSVQSDDVSTSGGDHDIGVRASRGERADGGFTGLQVGLEDIRAELLSAPSLGLMLMVVSAKELMPLVTAVTLYSVKTTSKPTTASMALKAASTGPVPTTAETCVVPSADCIRTVAVGKPVVPHTT